MFAVQCRSVMARCDVVLLASSVWRLAPQETEVRRTVGSVKGAGGAEWTESARERTAVNPPEPSPKPRDPRQRPGEARVRATRQGGQASSDPGVTGSAPKSSGGPNTPAHAKVGGVMVLAGLACCRFSRKIFGAAKIFDRNRASFRQNQRGLTTPGIGGTFMGPCKLCHALA